MVVNKLIVMYKENKSVL